MERSKRMLAVLECGAAPVRLQKRYIRPDGSSVAANLFVTRFSEPDRLVSTLFWSEHERPLPPARLWEAALRIRHVHAARANLFGNDLSTDPVGSLLTGMYLAEAEGRNFSLVEAAEFAGLTSSTATRWLTLLRQKGFVQHDLSSGRGIQLTQEGLLRTEAMLAAVYEVPDTVMTVSQH
ncbi:PAS domain S-box protein [Sphingomonas sp. KR1UV-12]|uniref:PAS domain S-box protein n=1 Tax=Sphingomonas aurea TaxID=3063994 RepID=A0ABT9EJ80_9SPHN|nr:PAS domain S-box protein [Sphingomonas sp. KR1UV-12]MDP1027018.1 PAS domain S-box protein [Sphingomonas sp. KR1UV-12]